MRAIWLRAGGDWHKKGPHRNRSYGAAQWVVVGVGSADAGQSNAGERARLRIGVSEMEGFLELVHGGVGHALGDEAHGACVLVDLRGLDEDVDLVECLGSVIADGYYAVLLPKYYIVLLQALDGLLCQLDARGHLVGDDAQALGAEGACLGDHGPEQTGEHVGLEESGVVRHGHELDGMCVDGYAIGRASGDEVVVDGQMRGQLGGGPHGIVGYHLVVGAVGQDAYHRTVVHRPSCQVAHAAACALAEEHTAGDVRQSHAYLGHRADGLHAPYTLQINMLGDVDGDIAAITLSPAFLPKIAGHFGGFEYLVFGARIIV